MGDGDGGDPVGVGPGLGGGDEQLGEREGTWADAAEDRASGGDQTGDSVGADPDLADEADERPDKLDQAFDKLDRALDSNGCFLMGCLGEVWGCLSGLWLVALVVVGIVVL